MVLYKKDSSGKVLQWSAEVFQGGHSVDIRLRSGEYAGKLTETFRRDVKGKNIGKANETSPFTQAQADVSSLYNKKRKEGYRSTEELGLTDVSSAFGDFNLHKYLLENLKFYATDANDNAKPMLCQPYYRSKKNWTAPDGTVWDDRKYYYIQYPRVEKEENGIIAKFPALVQAKINGNRATTFLQDTTKILSRTGGYANVPHIADAFNRHKECFTQDDLTIIFDGELYIPGEKLQHINSAIKALNINTNRVEYHVFDIAVEGMPQIDRIKLMKQLLAWTLEDLNCPIKIVPTYKVANDDQVQTYCDRFIDEGHEGVVVKRTQAEYAFGGRPMNWTKLKRAIKQKYDIVDIIPQDKNPSLGMFVCRSDKGEEFKVNPKGNDEYKEALLYTKSMYIGKELMCTFYEHTDGKDIPFHVIDNVVIE